MKLQMYDVIIILRSVYGFCWKLIKELLKWTIMWSCFCLKLIWYAVVW